eukprot:gene20270-24312_t
MPGRWTTQLVNKHLGYRYTGVFKTLASIDDKPSRFEILIPLVQTLVRDNVKLNNDVYKELKKFMHDYDKTSPEMRKYLQSINEHEGTSYQVAYNKYLVQTATRFSVAAWRYASQDYRTFSDHLYENDKHYHQSDYNDFYDIGRKKYALWRNYWGRSGNAKDYQFSYSNNWQHISYTFSASQSYDENNKEEERFNLFISIPFYWGDDIAKTRHQINLSNSTSFSKDGYSSNNTGITGIAGEHDQLNYDGSYSHSKNAWQSGGSISSGLVVWSGGINITNQLSDTFAILDAPGLEGAHINGQKYNRTNSKGQVVYDPIIPHRENHLVLDIANSESETELQGNRQIIAPYRGAVSYVQFTTDQRKPWYIQALRPDGSPLTFGYDVLDLQENNIGVVGQGSRLFIRVDEIPTGIKEFTMKWLLLITLSLYSFIVQSAPCALTNVGEQRGTYILKPLSMKGNLTAEKIENTGNIIECTDLQETTNAIKVHFLTQNALRFKVGSRHYIINFPFEYDGKKIELPGKSSYNLEEMLSAINFTIPYSIASVSDSSNTADIFPGTPFPLLFEIEVNLMTCGFEDQSIDTGRFVLSRINNENYQFHHIRFDCIQGEQGELVFEPSDVEYYFEPVTIQESGTSILKNELENSEDGAGQVGFQLSNDGTNEIQYGKSNYYSFQHPHEGSNQIPLFIRP